MDSSNKTSRASSTGIVETPAPTEEAVPSFAEACGARPDEADDDSRERAAVSSLCASPAGGRAGRRLEGQRPPPPEGADGGGWGVGAAGSMGMRRRGRSPTMEATGGPSMGPFWSGNDQTHKQQGAQEGVPAYCAPSASASLMPYRRAFSAMSDRRRPAGAKQNGGNPRPPSVSPRGNVKTNSHLQTKAQWKEELRRGCLERAKAARRKKLRRARQHNCSGEGGGLAGSADSNANNGNGSSRLLKRGRDDNTSEWNDDEINAKIVDLNGDNDASLPPELTRLESGDSETNVVDAARALVEQELQRAMTGMHHYQQVCPLDGGAPAKRERGAAMEYEEIEEPRPTEEEYRISHEEFAELLNDVTEELQREGELLEEEIWEMERADAMERERLMHQIDDFDSWEELERQQNENAAPSTYISPLASLDSSLVTCPICNSSSLIETPHGGIACSKSALPDSCTFRLDIAHEGLTLNHLQDQLRGVYEEHSAVCKGILQFRMESRVGMNMLMAKCDACSSDVVVL
ncbi:hypothetical protein ACHAXT_008377 [Thalassiosira profunda]